MRKQNRRNFLKAGVTLGGTLLAAPVFSFFGSHKNNVSDTFLTRTEIPNPIKANWVMIDTLTAFGNQRGLTAAQVGLAWPLAQKPWIVPIPGTTKLAHLQENLWSADYVFTTDELRQLDKAFDKITIVGERYIGVQAKQVNK